MRTMTFISRLLFAWRCAWSAWGVAWVSTRTHGVDTRVTVELRPGSW